MNAWDAYTAAHTVTPYLVAVMTALVSLGFLQVVFLAGGMVKYLTLGFLLLYLKVFLRTAYWDILPNWVPPETWSAWREASGGVAVNVFFNLAAIVACYFSLKAVYLAIPEEDRARYTILTAPFYRVVTALRGARRE